MDLQRTQNWEDKPWENEELKKLEEALPRLKECGLEKVSKLHKTKTEVGCPGLDKRNNRKNRGVLEESGAEWKMAATS